MALFIMREKEYVPHMAYVLPVGYPISFGGNNSNDYYIERKDGDAVLNVDELNLWFDLHYEWSTLCQIDISESLSSSLIEKQVLIYGDTKEQLYKSLTSLFPIRQGYGFYSDDAHSIILGKNELLPTQTQCRVWNLSSGDYSLDDIANSLGISIDCLMDSLMGLVYDNFIYLR